jgi:rubredoxin
MLGAGMFYINPAKVFNLFSEVRKCPSCGAYNKVDIELGMKQNIVYPNY